MSFELKVTKEFLDLTDSMITSLKEKNTCFENGNVLLVKVPLENKSVIAIAPGKFEQDQIYQSGLARVIGVPRLLDEKTDARFKAGDFVIYNHASRYTISTLICHWLFGIKLAENQPHNYIEEYNNFPVISVTDVDVMAVIPHRA